MPSTVRLGQWRPRLRRHQSHCAASQIDFADHPLPHQLAVVGFDNLAHELVAGCSGETVVAALQFEIGIADAAAQQTNPRKAVRAPRAAARCAHSHDHFADEPRASFVQYNGPLQWEVHAR